jgi:signal transduction histidine kinase
MMALKHAVQRRETEHSHGPSLSDRLTHDLNNLLAIIIGAAEALTPHLNAAGGSLAMTGLRAAEQAQALLAGPPATDALTDCGEALASVADLVRPGLSGIAITASGASQPMQCRVGRAELEAALLNLCLNARDAMPDGGVLFLHLEAAWLIADPEVRPGAYVKFVVRDTGHGMPRDVLDRATEAHFTTKGDDGSGLGLANVEAFARKAGGYLELQSREGGGTSAILYLPRRLASTEASNRG